MRHLEQVEREQFIILKTRYDPGVGKPTPDCFSTGVSVQLISLAQSCPTFCDPMNCSTPGLPIHYQLPEFTQTHVH